MMLDPISNDAENERRQQIEEFDRLLGWSERWRRLLGARIFADTNPGQGGDWLKKYLESEIVGEPA